MMTLLIEALKARDRQQTGSPKADPRRTRVLLKLDARTLLKMLQESKTEAGILSWQIEPHG